MKKTQLLKKYLLFATLFLLSSIGITQVDDNVKINDSNAQTSKENNDPTGLLRWRREYPEQFQQQHKTSIDNNAHLRSKISSRGGAKQNTTTQEQVVNFDDLSFRGSFAEITNPYQGFNWTAGPAPMPGTCTEFNGGGLWVNSGGPQYVGTGYENGRTSEPNVAYNPFAGRPIEIEKSDGSAFTFVSGYFTAAFHPLHISFQGYNGSTLVQTSSAYTLSNTDPTLITLNWSNITRLIINIEETDCLSHLVMDDLIFRNDDVMAVSSFTLIDAEKDQDIGELKDGDVINLAALSTTQLSIRANTTPATTGSVVFNLSGPLTRNHTENTAPYALFVNNKADYFGAVLQPGNYTLTATTYSAANGGGTKGISRTIQFQVIHQLVNSFTLINADIDKDIRELKNGDVINLASLPAGVKLNIRANTSPATVGSVVFELSGPVRLKEIQNSAPYALYSDHLGNYFGAVLQPGKYTLKATPYSAANASGHKGRDKTISFSVMNQALITQSHLSVSPNPFSSQATISFSVPQSGYTTLEVIDQKGAVSERLYAAQAEAGKVYNIPFNSKQRKSGVYVLRLISGRQVQTYNLMLMQ